MQLLPHWIIKQLASHCFSVAGPTVWNSLPSGIHDSSFTHTFRDLFETHCFQAPAGLRLPLATHRSASDSATG